ncbi:hypothetical protein BU16DRAFT_613466 [Lophium mytilinum]|uniref:Uncharacterized protein n=1 Tax=Lophium mytilinum TaxID=390894 RepID=A0A6A6RAM5_9PEZI|nr:hypothetical protein BU16DRAFT_613466 [Lophium mytilinum]
MARRVTFPGLDLYIGQLHGKLSMSLASKTYPSFSLELYGTTQSSSIEYHQSPPPSGLSSPIARRIMLPGLNLDVLRLGGILKLCFEGLEGARLVYELAGCDEQLNPATITTPFSHQADPEKSPNPTKSSSESPVAQSSPIKPSATKSSAAQSPANANGNSNQQKHLPASKENVAKPRLKVPSSSPQDPESVLNNSITQQSISTPQTSSTESLPSLSTPRSTIPTKSPQTSSTSPVSLDAGHPVQKPTVAVAVVTKAASLNPTSAISTPAKAAWPRSPQVPAITDKRPCNAPTSAPAAKKIKIKVEGHTVSNVTAPDKRYGLLGYLEETPIIKAENPATTEVGSGNSELKTSTVTQAQPAGINTVPNSGATSGLQAPAGQASTVNVAISEPSPDSAIQIQLLETKVLLAVRSLEWLKGKRSFDEVELPQRREAWKSYLMAFQELASFKAKQTDTRRAQDRLIFQAAGEAIKAVAKEKEEALRDMDVIYVYGYNTTPRLGFRTYGKLRIDLKARSLHWEYVDVSRAEDVSLYASTSVSLTRASPGILLLELRAGRMGIGTYFSIKVSDSHKIHGVTPKSYEWRKSHTENNIWVYPGVVDIIKSLRPLSKAKSMIANSSATASSTVA